jgi:hypothetical protein
MVLLPALAHFFLKPRPAVPDLVAEAFAAQPAVLAEGRT